MSRKQQKQKQKQKQQKQKAKAKTQAKAAEAKANAKAKQPKAKAKAAKAKAKAAKKIKKIIPNRNNPPFCKDLQSAFLVDKFSLSLLELHLRVVVFVSMRLSNHPLTQSVTQRTASVHTLHMSKPVITFVFKVLRNALLRCILYAFWMAAQKM